LILGFALVTIAPVFVFALVTFEQVFQIFPDKSFGTEDVLPASQFIWLVGYPALALCAYWQFIRGAIYDTYILSNRTLALVRARKPVRYIKVRDVKAIRPVANSLELIDGTELMLPRAGNGPCALKLADALITNWRRTEAVDDSRIARAKSTPIPRWVTWAIIAIEGTFLVCGIILATMGMWLALTLLFLVTALVAMVAVPVALLKNSGAVTTINISPNPADRSPSSGPGGQFKLVLPRDRSCKTIQRLPNSPPSAMEFTAINGLIILTLELFIPCYLGVYRYGAPDAAFWNPSLVVALSVSLVMGYYAQRIYKALVRGDMFVTLVLSSRTIAIVRPRRPVVYLKPEQCKALILGRNELVLDDGRSLHFGATRETLVEPDLHMKLMKHGWPEVYEAEIAKKETATLRVGRTHLYIAALLVATGLGAHGLELIVESGWLFSIGTQLLLAGFVYGGFHVAHQTDYVIPLRERMSGATSVGDGKQADT